MILSWWKHRRRSRLRAQPVPDGWREILQRNVRHFSKLPSSAQDKLLADMQVFIAEKNWEGCRGFRITEEVQVTIAAQACLLVLGFENEYFDLVQSILVFPSDYETSGATVTDGGLVLEEDEVIHAGEAWYRGPVILSWEDVLDGGRHATDGENLVFHEFAHQLDMQNGRETDGMPLLASAEQAARWRDVTDREFDRLQQDCRRGRPTLLDCYGVEDRAEFFAVATECFFERPRPLSVRHPELYALLRDYFRQDPRQYGRGFPDSNGD